MPRGAVLPVLAGAGVGKAGSLGSGFPGGPLRAGAASATLGPRSVRSPGSVADPCKLARDKWLTCNMGEKGRDRENYPMSTDIGCSVSPVQTTFGVLN